MVFLTTINFINEPTHEFVCWCSKNAYYDDYLRCSGRSYCSIKKSIMEFLYKIKKKKGHLRACTFRRELINETIQPN
jgi:hypothetical protein